MCGKKELGTGKDPANRKWYEDGANHDGIGLYGGLTDTASTELLFDESQKAYTPQKVVCDTATLDNLQWVSTAVNGRTFLHIWEFNDNYPFNDQ